MSANSHNTLGLAVKVDDKRYYIFPNAGNNAENNINGSFSNHHYKIYQYAYFSTYSKVLVRFALLYSHRQNR